MAKEPRITLVGAQGRLGSEIAKITKIAHAIDRNNAGTFAAAAKSSDVILDVSSPVATEKLIQELSKSGAAVPYVIGCTGWTEAQLKAVHKYAEKTCVVLAPNFSPTVNLFLDLVERAAPLLKTWGYDVVVHETHHTRKVDAPSGTAKAIVERLGNMKAEVKSTRTGDVVGTHEVRFTGAGDILELSHEALDRSIFAQGAVMAAMWAAQHPRPGLYSMRNVIFGENP